MLLTLLHWLGYGVCHQIPDRTIHLAGQALPLCARCSGIYLGAVLGFVTILLLGRTRHSALPPTPVLAVLLGFVALMGVDGLNSYLTFFPGLPHLYEPQNVLRLTTGMLHGLALSFIVYPVFSYTFWKETDRQPVLRNLRELGSLVLCVALLILLVESDLDFLLYPLAIVESLGLLAMFSLLNGAIFLLTTGHEGRASRPRDALLPLLAGLLMSLTEIAILDAVRLWLTALLGLPF